MLIAFWLLLLENIMRIGIALAAAALFAIGSFTALRAADPATAPATMPACCGASCKAMPGCCKADATGKVTCAMGGSCCTKAK
jgi:hypothetical protein